MSLNDWAEGRDPASERAKKKLSELPPSPTGRGAKVPFPFGDKSAYKSLHSNHAINEAIVKAPLQTISFKRGLRAIQHSVKPAHVLWYIDHPDAKPRQNTTFVPVDHPIVIQQDGVRYIHDGHHRLTAAKLLGHADARVRFVDFDKE